MKKSGCTIIRNGVQGSYPFAEAISQVLPIVDEYVINVDKTSTDNTLEIVYKLAQKHNKIKILESEWDYINLRANVLSVETNKAIQYCTNDWIIYNQADEVFTDEAIEHMSKLNVADMKWLFVERFQL